MMRALRSLAWFTMLVSGICVAILTLARFSTSNDELIALKTLEFYWLISATILLGSWLSKKWLDKWLDQANQSDLEKSLESGTFEARGSFWRATTMAGLCLLLAFGIPASLMRNETIMAMAAFFLLLLFLSLGWGLFRQLWRPGPLLKIDSHGLDHAMYGPIPWVDVIGLDLRITQIRWFTIHTLWIGVRNPHRYFRHAPWLVRWMCAQRSNRYSTFGPISIPLNELSKDASLIYRSAHSLRLKNAAPFLPSWRLEMKEKEVATHLDVSAMNQEMHQFMIDAETMTVDQAPALQARIEALQERSDALQPHIRSAVESSLKRTQRQARAGWVMLAILVALVVLQLVLRLN